MPLYTQQTAITDTAHSQCHVYYTRAIPLTKIIKRRQETGLRDNTIYTTALSGFMSDSGYYATK